MKILGIYWTNIVPMNCATREHVISVDENVNLEMRSLLVSKSSKIRRYRESFVLTHITLCFGSDLPDFAARLISPHMARSTQRRLTQNVGERDITVASSLSPSSTGGVAALRVMRTNPRATRQISRIQSDIFIRKKMRIFRWPFYSHTRTRTSRSIIIKRKFQLDCQIQTFKRRDVLRQERHRFEIFVTSRRSMCLVLRLIIPRRSVLSLSCRRALKEFFVATTLCHSLVRFFLLLEVPPSASLSLSLSLSLLSLCAGFFLFLRLLHRSCRSGA